MWTLLLVILVNGGAGVTKFETRTYSTEQQCLAAQRKAENDSTYGYCTLK